MKVIIKFVLLAIINPLLAQSPSRVDFIACDEIINLQQVKIDFNDDLIIAGDFEGEVDFDIGPSEMLVQSDHFGTDYFIAKYDKDGALSWTITTGDNSDQFERVYLMDIDDLGNIYVVGVESKPKKGYFIMKVSPQGAIVWKRVFESNEAIVNPEDYYIKDIDINQNGDILITGFNPIPIDWDPGNGSLILDDFHIDQRPLMIVKLNSNGELVWGKSVNAPLNQACTVIGFDVCTDHNDDIYITGTYMGTVDFDPGPDSVIVVSELNNRTSGFLLKLNSSGEFDFVNDYVKASSLGLGVEIMDDNVILVTKGITYDSVGNDIELIGSSRTVVHFLSHDGELLNYKEIGTLFGGQLLNPTHHFFDMTITPQNDILIGGRFHAVTDFDPSGPGELLLSDYNGVNYRLGLTKLDMEGNIKWLKTFYGGLDLTSNSHGHPIGVGTIQESTIKLADTTIVYQAEGNSIDGFITYYSQSDCDGNRADLMVYDSWNDDGSEPNPHNVPVWRSPKVGPYLANTLKSNIKDYSNRGQRIKAKVVNIGCEEHAFAKLEYYYTLTKDDLNWPEAWVENYEVVGTDSVLVGNKLAELDIPLLSTGNVWYGTIILPWDPVLDKLGETERPIHILARIVSSIDVMTFSEEKNISLNVRNNNNLAWRMLNLEK